MCTGLFLTLSCLHVFPFKQPYMCSLSSLYKTIFNYKQLSFCRSVINEEFLSISDVRPGQIVKVSNMCRLAAEKIPYGPGLIYNLLDTML